MPLRDNHDTDSQAPANSFNLNAMIKQYYLLLVLMLMSVVAYTQDPMFSQFYAAPLQVNPAFTGVTYAPRITLNYRNQWAQISGGYQTYALAYEQSIEALNSGFGLMLLTDNAMDGVYKTNRFSAVYAYQVQVNNDFFIRLGVEAGLIQARIDWDRLRFGDQIDPINGFGDPSGNPNFSNEQRPPSLNNTVADISAGLLLYAKSFYGGVSVKHLNSPDQRFFDVNANLSAGLPLRTTLHGGLEIELPGGNNQNTTAFISPNVLLVKQGDFAQFNGGAYAGFGKFFGGLWYRHAFTNSDAAIILAGFREGALRIGYSYDFTVSGLAASNPGGTHEVSLTINFEDTKEAQRRRRASRYNDCFKMFR